MTKKLYVGNLPYSTTSPDLERMFTPFGAVNSAQVIEDRVTGKSKGFGFVEMASSDDGQKAIDALNGKQVDGRTLTVNEARPREDRGGGGGGGGRGFGGGGGDRDFGGRGPRGGGGGRGGFGGGGRGGRGGDRY